MAKESPVKIIDHPTQLGIYRIGIWSDDNPQDPRENDNLGTMVCWHRNYRLGDEQIGRHGVIEWLERMAERDSNAKRFDGMDSQTLFTALLTIARKRYIILPLYLYDHSGITMSTSPFGCGWDSGQVGFIYYDTKRNKTEGYTTAWLRKYHKGKTIRQVIEDMLISEVKEYDQYITNDVYGYEVFKPGDDVELGNGGDSCWGFFGYNKWKDNGLLECATNAIDCDVRKRMDEKKSQLTKHFRYLKYAIRQGVNIKYRTPLQLNY